MSNLGQQFEPKKPRWVPDKGGTDVRWHVSGEHKGGAPFKNPTKYDFDAWHEIHMQHHADGVFTEGEEHQHFTPASWKKYQKKKK